MAVLKSIAVIFSLAVVAMIFVPPAQAGVWSERTELSFSGPVEVPGAVLQAGTYWFVLSSDQSDRNVVEILDAKQNKVLATLETIPATRRNVPGKTEVVLVKRKNAPDALWKWYYPGRHTGHEFIYKGDEEAHLRRDTKQIVYGLPMSSTASGKAS